MKVGMKVDSTINYPVKVRCMKNKLFVNIIVDNL